MSVEKAPPSIAAARRPPRSRADALQLLERIGLLILTVIAIAVFSTLRPTTFASAANWIGMGINYSVIVVAAMALIIPLNTGRFDLSVGSNMVLSSMIAGGSMSVLGAPLPVAIVLTLLLGTLVGAVNGVVVAYLGVNSFVATLGMATLIDGAVIGIWSGQPIAARIDPALLQVGYANVLGIPDLVLIFLIVSLLTWYLLTQTPYGRYVTAVGSNISSANLVGVKTKRVVLQSLIAAGALSGIGGIMLIPLQGNANPSASGIGIVLPALAAAFLGSTAFTPGRFNVPGTLVGLLFVAGTVSGLASLGAQPWVQPVLNGIALIVAVALSTQIRRARTGVREVGQ